MINSTLVEPESAARDRAQVSRRVRRWCLGSLLAAGVAFAIFEPAAPAGERHMGWPASQLGRRAFINCYHAFQRRSHSTPLPAQDAGTRPVQPAGARP